MAQLINSLMNFDFWALGKFFVLIGLLVYLAFAFVMVRQVKSMTEVINGLMTSTLRLVSWLFFLFSVGVFIFVLLFL